MVYKRQLFFQYSRPSGCDTSKLLSDDLKNKLYYDGFWKVLYHYSHHYDSKDHVFELAEKFEARQQEKKTEIDEKAEEKGSVLKDLKDKQKEAAAKPPVKDAAEKAAKSKGREVL